MPLLNPYPFDGESIESITCTKAHKNEKRFRLGKFTVPKSNRGNGALTPGDDCERAIGLLLAEWHDQDTRIEADEGSDIDEARAHDLIIRACDVVQLRFSRRRTLILKGLEDPVTVFTVARQAPEAPRQIESRDPEVFIELRGVEGSLAGWACLFDAAVDRRIIIGRDPACTVVIKEVGISRQQSIIWCDKEGYWTIIDLGTPIYGLNEGPIPSEPLRQGDRIRFGSCLLEVSRLRHRKQ